jgi:hypothetical protein
MKWNEADDMTFESRHGVCAGQDGVSRRDGVLSCTSISRAWAMQASRGDSLI